MKSRQKVAIIGAGPMGLATAYQLAKQGYCPVVFETDNRVGGMSASFDFNGLMIERYYHFHCISDSAFFLLLDELNLSDKMRWVETRMGYWYQGKLQDWGNPFALLKFDGLGMIAKVRYGLHAFLSTKRNDWRPLDGLKATEWIKRWVGKEAYEVLWRRLFDYKFHHYSNNLSAAWIWSRIRRIGRSRFNIFREKLGYLEGGSETLLQAMKAYIEANGGEFRLDTPVSRVVLDDSCIVKGLEIHGQLELFEHVVSTVPLPYLPKMIPDLPERVLSSFRAVNNIAVVCVIAKLKRAVTDKFWLNVNDPAMDIPGIVEYSNLRPMSEHVVYVPFYIPVDDPKFQESDQVFQDKVKRYLCTINPSLVAHDFLELSTNRYQYAQPICQPNFLESLPPVELPIQGLWVADTSYYYPEDRGISESIDFGRMIGQRISKR